jgi:hypothetical protein
VQAAVRYFGSWQAAIESAGLNYEEIHKYKVWTKERILDRIRELHQQGEDLSWRHVSLRLDPALAASAVKKNHFGSWQEALEQAGLDYEQIRRYQEWSHRRCCTEYMSCMLRESGSTLGVWSRRISV